ncbi:class I SAM-dependent methyltransferase [Clostridiaceae bacterium 35-E11]
MREFDKVYRYYDIFMKVFQLYKVEEIKDALKLQGNEKIVDIGGGTGHLAQHLWDQCNKIYVVDESERMLSQIKTNEKILPILGDGLNTNFEDRSMDVVILADVMHHIEKQQKLIEEVHRILKEKGRILILDFDRKHLRTKLLRCFEYFLFGKLYFRTSKEAKDLLGGKFAIESCMAKKYYFIIVGEKR